MILKIVLNKYQFHSKFTLTYAECNLKSVESYEGSSYSKKYQDHIPCNFVYKLVCVDDKFTKSIVVFRGENVPYEFAKAILKEYQYYKRAVKKYFNKKLIISEEEEQFQLNNTCWICEKLIHDDNGKVINRCHITGELRGAAHWSCNINLQLTKKVTVIFHDLRDCDSNLIFCKLNKFNVKIDVIPNRLEKYVAFVLNKNLVFIGRIQFMNYSLEDLGKNLAENEFKYFISRI